MSFLRKILDFFFGSPPPERRRRVRDVPRELPGWSDAGDVRETAEAGKADAPVAAVTLFKHGEPRPERAHQRPGGFGHAAHAERERSQPGRTSDLE